MTDSTHDPLQTPNTAEHDGQPSPTTSASLPHRDASGTKLVPIFPEIPAPSAWDLALFLKRVHFDQCLELTDAWRSRSERANQAHRMISGLSKIADALAEAGYAPR